MSFALMKTTFKKNWILLLIFFAVLTMYLTVMISMYNPDDMSKATALMRTFPSYIRKAMGFATIPTNFTGFLASSLYGFFMFGFPLVYCIILGNKLVAKQVDNGSFAYLLSTPNSRTKIVATQGFCALVSVAVLFAALFGIGVLASGAMFPGSLDVVAFFRLNVTTMLVNMAVMMIVFFFSCLFNSSKTSQSLGAGIPIAFILMYMLGGVSKHGEAFRHISIYGFYDPAKLVGGESVAAVDSVYVVMAVVLFAAGILVFRKKRLPL